MTDIDKQRIAAVKALEDLGYKWTSSGWAWPNPLPPWRRLVEVDLGKSPLLAIDDQRPGHVTWIDRPLEQEADALHSILLNVAASLAGAEDLNADRKRMAAALHEYERVRWPDGKIPGGKG